MNAFGGPANCRYCLADTTNFAPDGTELFLSVEMATVSSLGYPVPALLSSGRFGSADIHRPLYVLVAGATRERIGAEAQPRELQL